MPQLPTGTAVRRNAPTIPTTTLPASGRQAPAPTSPYELGTAGHTWWTWAWATPQACAWDDGQLYAIARRARLEDAMAAAESLTESAVITTKMDNLDVQLGLTPKGLAQLRWKIVADDQATGRAPTKPKARRLKAV